jgi:hypothetical protein
MATTQNNAGFKIIMPAQTVQTLTSGSSITQISLATPIYNSISPGYQKFFVVDPKTEQNFNYIWPVPMDQISSPASTTNFVMQASTGEPEIPTGVDGNLSQTQVTEGLGTAYDLDPLSLNVPSVRDLGQNPSLVMHKIEIPEDPADGQQFINSVPALKNYPGIAMFFEMADSKGHRMGIEVPGLFQVRTLKLSPNPSTLSISSTKKINRFSTMSGWVEEHWGDDIDTISFNGSFFSFFGTDEEKHYGLTNEFAELTDSYQYIKELINFFQVNGCIYQGNDYSDYMDQASVNDFLLDNPEFVNNHPRKGMIKERLYVKMNYDYLTLYGRFESLDIIESSTAPYNNSYSAVFKAEKTIYNLNSNVSFSEAF